MRHSFSKSSTEASIVTDPKKKRNSLCDHREMPTQNCDTSNTLPKHRSRPTLLQTCNLQISFSRRNKNCRSLPVTAMYTVFITFPIDCRMSRSTRIYDMLRRVHYLSYMAGDAVVPFAQHERYAQNGRLYIHKKNAQVAPL